MPWRPPDLGRHGRFFHAGENIHDGCTTEAQRRLLQRLPDRLGPRRARRAELDAVLAGHDRLVRALLPLGGDQAPARPSARWQRPVSRSGPGGEAGGQDRHSRGWRPGTNSMKVVPVPATAGMTLPLTYQRSFAFAGGRSVRRTRSLHSLVLLVTAVSGPGAYFPHRGDQPDDRPEAIGRDRPS